MSILTDERIDPCEGCEDYDGENGCKSKGGCAINDFRYWCWGINNLGDSNHEDNKDDTQFISE